MTSFVPWLVLLLGALIPGVLTWWWGRRLHRHIGDPLFPERYWHYRKQVGMASAVAGAVAGVFLIRADLALFVFLPFFAILIIGLSFANYETRKPIFGDTWSFATYAWFYFRVVAVFLGSWLLLALAPFLIERTGAAAPVVSVLVVGALIAYQFSSSRTTARLLGATPLDDEGINASLSRLLAKTSLTPPFLFQAGPPGGVIANALALPSLGGGGVLFFRTVLERLSPIEIEAILAHELAHLEQFNERVLRRNRRIIVSLILAGAGVLPHVLQRTDTLLVPLIWVGTLLAAIVFIGGGAKARETAGDLRAAELVGDPEALISALTHVYAIGHLPRRWDASTESRATHPALARRISALRAVAPAPALHDSSPIVIAARTPGELLVFDVDRVRYLRDAIGDPANVPALIQSAGRAESFPYNTISSVHVAPLTVGADIVIERGSTTVARVPVASEQVPAVQAALDRFEVQFAHAAAPRPYALTVRLVAAFVGLLGYILGPAVVMAQSIVAVVGSSPRAAAALAAATTTLTLYRISTGRPDVSAHVIMGFLSPIAWILAVRWRREVKDDGPRARLEIALLCVWAVVALIPFFLVGDSVLRIGQVASGPPAAIAAALSVGAWLWFSAERRSRATELAVLALLVFGGAVAVVGTTWFLDAYSHDPFLATRKGIEGQRFHETTIELTSASTPIQVPYGDVRLSPSGQAFVLVEPCDEEDEYACPRRGVAIGHTAGLRRTLEATDVQFLDDTRIVVLTSTDRDATLRTERVEGGADGWSVTLDLQDVYKLIVDTASGQWVVSAQRGDDPVLVRGGVGHTDVTRTVLASDVVLADDDHRYIEWHIEGVPHAVGTAERYVFYSDMVLAEMWRAVLPSSLRFTKDTAVVVGTTTPRVVAATALDVRCFDSSPAVDGVLCVAGDGRRTHVWRVHGGTGGADVIGWFDGTPWVQSRSADDRLVMSSGRCRWRVLDVATKTIATLQFPTQTCPTEVALSGGHVAVEVTDANGSQLHFFALR
jgi:heat shock protein HtpX